MVMEAKQYDITQVNFELLVEDVKGVVDLHALALKHKVSVPYLKSVTKLVRGQQYLELVKEKNLPKIYIVTETFTDDLQAIMMELKQRAIIEVNDHLQIEKKNEYDLIIAFDLEQNTGFFEGIAAIAKYYQIEWLHFSISKEKIHLGPLFSKDDEFCYKCYAQQEKNTALLYKNSCYQDELAIALPHLKKHITLLQQVHKRHSNFTNRELTLHLDTQSPSIVRMLNISKCKECKNSL